MNKPIFVTFTGVDDQTDLGRLTELSQRYPCEWGILVGGRLGKARYPSVARIADMAALGEKRIMVSLHLCGLFAVASNAGKLKIAHLSETDLDGFTRLQVNALTYNLETLSDLASRVGKDIIVQHRTGPFPEDLPRGIRPLHDQSGGKGKVPTKRPAQIDPTRLVGYAGGIGPENVLDVLDQISATDFWIDMESSLRTEDRFDLDRCAAVCTAVWPER